MKTKIKSTNVKSYGKFTKSLSKLNFKGLRHNVAQQEIKEKWGKAFLDKFENEFGQVTNSNSESNFGVGFYNITSGDKQFMVFDTYEDAERYAIGQVREDLESDPDMFNQDWLQDYYTITDTDRRMLANDLTDFDLDMADTELLENFEDEVDNFVTENSDRLTKIELDEDDKKGAELRSEFRDYIQEKRYDEHYKELENPKKHLVDYLGLYSEKDYYKQKFLSLDIDSASEDAVETDGIAHFLARYDGREKIIDGHFIYRTN